MTLQAYVTFHSYGQYILTPFGYDRKGPLATDSTELTRVGKLAAASMKTAGGETYTVGNSAVLLYPAAGTVLYLCNLTRKDLIQNVLRAYATGVSDDWAKGVPLIKYSYTIELRDTGTYGFLLPSTLIQSTAKEALAAVKTISEQATAAAATG